MDEVEDGNAATSENAQVWDEYLCCSHKLGVPHPAHVVEPASLAAVRLPELTYPIEDSLGELFQQGKLSALQIEGVAFACQKHTHILPNGTRCGFFLGDSAGIGKGRQIAGILFDSIARGRRRHLWVSTSADLAKDAKRDLMDLGCTTEVHEGVQVLDKAFAKGLGVGNSMKKGVLFCTYTTLVSGSGNKSRFQHICSWIGDPLFDGCIIFDECHKAKNFSESEDGGSKVSKAVVALQKFFPLARIVYASATGVTDIANLAYMERLGLWGDGAAFQTFDDFKTSMGKRNLGALEMLAMELKSTGMHVSRSLSYRLTTFETIKASLTVSDVTVYREAAAFWFLLRSKLMEAFKIAGGKPNLKVFWSCHQRFFKQLCVAFKVRSVVKIAREAIANGKCVVIGIQSTGEAALDFWNRTFGSLTQEEQKKKSLPILPPIAGCNLTLMQTIMSQFPKLQTLEEIGKDEDGLDSNPVIQPPKVEVERKREEVQSRSDKLIPNAGDNTLVKIRMLETIKKELLEAAAALQLPCNPLDDLIFQLGGHECVAEMTGRKLRIEVDEDNNRSIFDGFKTIAKHQTLADVLERCRIVTREKLSLDSSDLKSSDSVNLHEKDSFMLGRKLIAIISDAASTGISLHADKRAVNQRQRVHVTCELPWAADAAVQQLGRSHRSSQANAPEYKLVTSGIGGENRFTAAVAARLQSLGALTHGDRRASSGGVDLGEFNFNSKYGKSALAKIITSCQKKSIVQNIDYKNVVMKTSEHLRLAEEDCQRRSLSPESCGVISFWEGFQAIESEDLFVASIEEGLSLALEDQETKSSRLGYFSDREKSNVPKFLNRLLGLPVHLQNLLFNYFNVVLDSEIQQAKDDGVYDEGVSDLTANSLSLAGSPETLFTDSFTGGALVARTLRLDRGISFTDALAMLSKHVAKQGISLQEHLDDKSDENNPINWKTLDGKAMSTKGGGFFLSRIKVPGVGHLPILALRKASNLQEFILFRPNTGRSIATKSEQALQGMYDRVEIDSMKPIWDEIYTQTASFCQHGENCQRGDSCLSGRRISHTTILSGCTVPLWNHLSDSLHHHTLQIPKAERVLRIVRAELDDGSRVIGLKFNITAVSILTQHLRYMRFGCREVFLSKRCETEFVLDSSDRFVRLSPDLLLAGIKLGDIIASVNGKDVSSIRADGNTIESSVLLALERSNSVKLGLIDQTNAEQRGMTIEKVVPVDKKNLVAATRRENTIFSFFKAKEKKQEGGNRSSDKKISSRDNQERNSNLKLQSSQIGNKRYRTPPPHQEESNSNWAAVSHSEIPAADEFSQSGGEEKKYEGLQQNEMEAYCPQPARVVSLDDFLRDGSTESSYATNATKKLRKSSSFCGEGIGKYLVSRNRSREQIGGSSPESLDNRKANRGSSQDDAIEID